VLLQSGFTLKLISLGTGISAATYLNGKTASYPSDPYTVLSNIVLDSSGNPYVAGATDAADFPLQNTIVNTLEDTGSSSNMVLAYPTQALKQQPPAAQLSRIPFGLAGTLMLDAFVLRGVSQLNSMRQTQPQPSGYSGTDDGTNHCNNHDRGPRQVESSPKVRAGGFTSISNNVCDVKVFFEHRTARTPRSCLDSALVEELIIDDEGSHVICRGRNSVRPNHLSDRTFDHDYYFELPG